MPRPINAYIHPKAVQHNLKVVRQRAPDSRIWAVVKANAYGHGIERIYPGLEAADGIALLDLDEAVRVRQLGWKKPVLLLEGIFNCNDVKVAEEFDLTVAVHCDEQRELIVAAKPNRPIDIYLKMNSGMNRLGFARENFREAWERASASPGIGAVSLMTHFANADEGEVDWQLHSFDRATRDIPGARSLSNSAATMWHKRAHREWVRPGIVLYGGSPSGRAVDIADIPLRASMTLSSEIIGTQTMLAGETVGYARTYKTERETRIGVVACGYADGYPRHAPTGTPVSVDGVMTHTVGRVSMDMLTVDLTPCPNAGIGSKVELWGEQVKIDDVAASAGTIGYELMCALARRVPVMVAE
ncbi:alanine racemase 2, PLP-binding [Paraburkholderia piptadeniae]|uniref:Alanine racemase n=1 Tax=Paraburkholderia piptadeniae TaxID=1701573 RepID=A0A1N7RSI3_9BURK|nr:alanine racemase [Paraburkholderia piptadeniae]SIT38070.1 alanine racemase 2, PLP-binding [Paraburkholderia piptadeniae]